MIFLILFLNIIIAIEIINKFRYFNLINSIIKLTKKSLYIISNKKISDHWKEKIITEYSFKVFKSSIGMFLIILSIISLFILSNFIFSDLINFIFSLKGIILSIIFSFGYIYLKKIIRQ